MLSGDIQNNKLRILGKLTPSLIHEIRNPLSAIKLNLDLIKIILELELSDKILSKFKKINWGDFIEIFNGRDIDKRKKKLYDNFLLECEVYQESINTCNELLKELINFIKEGDK